jgi:TP901 family phage tail tape measure protein
MADVNINLNAKNNAKAALVSLTKDVSKMVSDVGSKMKNLGSGISNAGKKLAGIGLAGGAAFAGMTRTFAGFDDAMAKVSALSGATGEDLEKLRAKAKELGSTTKFSATQAAEGMNFLAMAGFDTNQILAGIPATLQLAAAGGLELAEAADIASDVGTMFGLTADEIGRVSDVLASTATSANTSVSMMGESFKYFGASAHTAGQSIEEASAAIALMAGAGIKASSAGTSLNQLMAAMVKKKGKFIDLGVAVADANGNMRPILDVMRDVGVAMEDMTNEEQLEWFAKLGVQSGKAGQILAGATSEQIETFRQKLENAEGAAGRMAETMQTGVGGAGTKILSAFEGLQISVMEHLKPALLVAAEAIATFFSNASKFVDQNPQLVKGLAAASAAFVALGGTLVVIGGSVTAMGVAVTGLGSIFATIGTIAGAVFSPIGIILGSIVGLIVYAVTASGAWRDMFAALKKIATETLQTLKEMLQGVKNALAIGDAGMALKIAFAGIKLAFLKALAGMFAAARQVLPMIWNIFKKVFQKIADFATNVMNTVIEAVKNPTKALDAYEKLKALFKSDKGFGDLGQEFLDGLADSAEAEFDQLNAIAAMKARTAGMTQGASFGDAARGVKGMLTGAAPEMPAMQDMASMAANLGLPALPTMQGGAMPAVPDMSGKITELQGQSNQIQSEMESALKKIEENTRSNNPHIQDKFEFDVNEAIGPAG